MNVFLNAKKKKVQTNQITDCQSPSRTVYSPCVYEEHQTYACDGEGQALSHENMRRLPNAAKASANDEFEAFKCYGKDNNPSKRNCTDKLVSKKERNGPGRNPD